MIIQENLTIKGKEFVKTYSDAGRYVVRDGVEYDVATDPAELNRTYVEGDLISVDENEQEEASLEEIFNILLGIPEENTP